MLTQIAHSLSLLCPQQMLPQLLSAFVRLKTVAFLTFADVIFVSMGLPMLERSVLSLFPLLDLTYRCLWPCFNFVQHQESVKVNI